MNRLKRQPSSFRARVPDEVKMQKTAEVVFGSGHPSCNVHERCQGRSQRDQGPLVMGAVVVLVVLRPHPSSGNAWLDVYACDVIALALIPVLLSFVSHKAFQAVVWTIAPLASLLGIVVLL
jgi:hypothetical protein